MLKTRLHYKIKEGAAQVMTDELVNFCERKIKSICLINICRVFQCAVRQIIFAAHFSLLRLYLTNVFLNISLASFVAVGKIYVTCT